MPLYVWLVVAVIMAIVELVSFGLISVWFVIGALAAFVSALFGANVYIQTIVFIVISVIFLLIFRPIALKYRNKNQSEEPTLVGKQGIVIEEINNELLSGRVELDDHVSWIARSADGSVISKDEQVVVVNQESIKLFVERTHS